MPKGGKIEATFVTGLDVLAADLTAGGVAPACAVGFARVWSRQGWLARVGGAEATFFDLASVTKPVCAVAAASVPGLLHAPLQEVLPELRGTWAGPMPIEWLLAHRAGLEAHQPLYAPLERGEPFDANAALAAAADSARAECRRDPRPAAGYAPVYSDMGYALVGAALARACGAEDAGDAMERLVLEPLGLAGAMGTARGLRARLGASFDECVAPTEDVDWRGGLVVGAVHDENAWALTAYGGSGHAGLFGRVDAVLAFGAAVLAGWAHREGPLAHAPLASLIAPRPGGSLRAGFDGKSAEGSSAGALASDAAFGHLGFTGTSLWIDPAREAVVALLTNRVSPTRANVAIRKARPRAHDALFAAAAAISHASSDNTRRFP